MQLFVIDWLFQNSEDQLFATNEFCEYLKNGKINKHIEGFELTFIAHTPQNGSGVIICKAENANILLRIFNMWRKNFNISFNYRPALTNDELLSSFTDKSVWSEE